MQNGREMAIKRSGWLYFDSEELPDWAKDGRWTRTHKVANTQDDWIISDWAEAKAGESYQKWYGKRLQLSALRDGTYEVKVHGPTSVYLRYISPYTDTTEKYDKEFNPATATVQEARDWLIWREFKLLQKGKVPQGWANVSAAFLQKVKEREQARKAGEEQKQLTTGKEPPKVIKTEEETLHEIINSVNASPKDKMAAQARLNEINNKNGTADNSYNPEPIIKVIE